MRGLRNRPFGPDRGYTLIEVMVAMLLTMIVMAAVYALLQKGQGSFRREPEVTDLNQSARAGLDRISRDLVKAGYQTPPAMAIAWGDGGGINPDEVTIVYADDSVPTSKPICSESGGGADGGSAFLAPEGLFPGWLGGLREIFGRSWSSLFPIVHAGGGGAPCRTIDRSATLYLDPLKFDPPQVDPTQAYHEGQILFAIELSDCDGNGEVGIVPFELTQPPGMSSDRLRLNHNSGSGEADLNTPGGFNRAVDSDCCVIGVFHVIQYRINPPPPTENPMLERRDLAVSADWIPVSNNIENLQVEYAVGTANVFLDVPAATPHPDFPGTWITQVRVKVAGRTQSRNLEGATPGVFASTDTHLRKTFSTTVSLRNQAASAAAFGSDVGQSFTNYN